MPAGNPPMRVDMEIDGAAALLRKFNALPKEANKELRAAALQLSGLLAQEVRSAGMAEGRQAAELVPTVKARRDRIPSVSIGGTKRIFRGKKDRTQQEAYRALFGSEFGGNGHGFKPPRSGGYWIRPAIKAAEPEIAREWRAAAERIVADFNHGGLPPVGAP